MKIVMVLYPGGGASQNKEILGCAENALGLRDYLSNLGHELVVLTNKEEEFDKHIVDANIIITTPFWPAYITRERISKAPNLSLILTAGIGSDHIDLKAASERNITVAEITNSNVVSVAEHVVMHILVLVRNFVPAYNQVLNGQWDIAAIASNAHDLEHKTVGIIGGGRIGQRVATRLKNFDVRMYYYDNFRLSTVEEFALGLSYMPLHELVSTCDIISINCPLTPQTDNLFDRNMLFSMKKGAYLINTARGKIVNTEALVEALKSGHLKGYAGDVWYPQPAPQNHPWRNMPNHAMTPHVSGTTIEAQKRYASGIKECLERFFNGKALPKDFLIVEHGKVVSASYSYAFV